MQKLLKFDNFCILQEENASIIVDRSTGIISTADSTVELMMGRLFDELCANILQFYCWSIDLFMYTLIIICVQEVDICIRLVMKNSVYL